MLIRKTGETAWRAPRIQAYSDEAVLQALVAGAPDLLPGGTGAPLAVVREMSVVDGYVDLVGVDPGGNITIVECKLRANPETRRTIVGQIFAYASGLWGLTYEAFDSAFAARAGAPLAERVAALGAEPWDEEAFRAAVAANLAAGRFRLVIAVDAITEELKRIVRYLNTHTDSALQVLALELSYVADEGVEILLLATYGAETAASKPAAGRKWDVDSVFDRLASFCSPAAIAQARHLAETLQTQGYVLSTGTGPYPSLNAQWSLGNRVATPLSFYEWPAGTARCAINFGYLEPFFSPEELARLADRLRPLPVMEKALAGLEAAQYRKRPGFPLDSLLTQPGAVETIAAALADLTANL
jgi:hypothetical protein